MKAMFKGEAPIALEGDGLEFRLGEIGGGMSVSFVQVPAGGDMRPALTGLQDDLCQCPHWGYVLSGKVRMHTRDGSEDYESGQAFYWAAGHAPEALEDSEYIDFSPTEEIDHVIEHIQAQG